MEISAADLSMMVMRERHRRNFCLQRYTPQHWWECDVFEMTKGGSFREFEVKITAKDFQVDKTKKIEPRVYYDSAAANKLVVPPSIFKHDQLAKGDPRGPQFFWFVMPLDIVAIGEIPSWAGLMIGEHRGGGWVCSKVVKAAPKLHSQPLDPKIADHARGICYWRMHDLQDRLHKAKRRLSRKS